MEKPSHGLSRRRALGMVGGLAGATILSAGGLSAMRTMVPRPARAANGLKVRRDITLMADNDPWFDDYAAAIKAMHALATDDPRSWRSQALIHLDHCPHGQEGFFYWHRLYLKYYEDLCGSLIGKPDFALGYWNWSNNQGRLPGPFFDDGPLNVTYWNDPSNAQSNNWSPQPVETVGTRALTPTYGLLDSTGAGNFTAAHINSIMRQTDFIQFWHLVEGGPHNNGHVISGVPNGHMISGMSPLDPIFWLHHANVDRLWAEWQQAGNTSPMVGFNYDGNFVNSQGVSQQANADEAIDFEALGYTYNTIDDGLNADLLAGLAAPDPQALARLAISANLLAAVTPRLRIVPLKASSARVVSSGLKAALLESRSFRPHGLLSAKGVATEPKRILARLSGISVGGPVDQVVVNVFVNCPYLTPQTPHTDPHYAGSFGFFGGADMMHQQDRVFLVDISNPLLQQLQADRLDPEGVDLQFMAVPAGPEARFEKARVSIDRVELLSV